MTSGIRQCRDGHWVNRALNCLAAVQPAPFILTVIITDPTVPL